MSEESSSREKSREAILKYVDELGNSEWARTLVREVFTYGAILMKDQPVNVVDAAMLLREHRDILDTFMRDQADRKRK